MTLTIHKEEDEQRQLTLKVEVAEKRVQQAMKSKARELARDLHIPGFRRGRAPYRVILRRFGAEAIRAEAVDGMVQDVFTEVLVQAEIEDDIYGQPRLENMELEPFNLEFVVPLAPAVTLGDYRTIRKEIEEIDITEEAVDEAVERIQTQHQTLETAERPAEEGDVVSLSGTGTLTPLPEEESEADDEAETANDEAASEEETAGDSVEDAAEEASAKESSEEDEAAEEAESDEANEGESDEADDDEEEETQGEIIFQEFNRDFLLDDSKVFIGTPFVEKLLGTSASDEVSFTFTFPEGYEDEELVGREVTFELTINEVKDREVPSIDDELAVLNGRFDTLAELREGLRDDLHKQAEEQAKNELIESMIDSMLEDTEMVYPPAAVDLEIDEMIASFRQQVSQSGWEFDDFLRLQNETEESLRDNFRENGVERLKRRLVLRQLIVDEKITVEQDDIEAALDERVSRFGDNEELQKGMRDYFGQGQGLEMISSEILNDKVNDRIKAIVTGNAPDLDALEAEKSASDEEE
ncbi:MAG: trigger factor [Chloroflexota bacterium]